MHADPSDETSSSSGHLRTNDVISKDRLPRGVFARQSRASSGEWDQTRISEGKGVSLLQQLSFLSCHMCSLDANSPVDDLDTHVREKHGPDHHFLTLSFVFDQDPTRR